MLIIHIHSVSGKVLANIGASAVDNCISIFSPRNIYMKITIMMLMYIFSESEMFYSILPVFPF